jgi:hypothetical protein
MVTQWTLSTHNSVDRVQFEDLVVLLNGGTVGIRPAGEPLSSLGAGRSDPSEHGRVRRAPEGLERNHRRLTNTAELRRATRYAANDRPPRMPQESRIKTVPHSTSPRGDRRLGLAGAAQHPGSSGEIQN